MTANTFVDLKVFPEVAYTRRMRIEVKRQRKIGYIHCLAEGHRFVTAGPLFLMTERDCDRRKKCDAF